MVAFLWAQHTIRTTLSVTTPCWGPRTPGRRERRKRRDREKKNRSDGSDCVDLSVSDARESQIGGELHTHFFKHLFTV